MIVALEHALHQQNEGSGEEVRSDLAIPGLHKLSQGSRERQL